MTEAIIKKVPNLPFYATSEGRILNKYGRPYKTQIACGYERISTRIGRKPRAFSVHRLVAMAFIDNPSDYPCVNHKDENRLNNKPENLEWCTHKYNCNYGTRGEKISRAEINRKDASKPVISIVNGKEVYYPSAKQAERELHIDNANINACCQGKRKTAGGYQWRYAD